MKMLYNSVRLVILFAVLCRMSQGEDTKTPSLPHPKLTVNQAGQVIRLECRPPADSVEVYKLELLKQHEFAEQFSNVSLVHVIKRVKEQPVFNLEDGEATFQGHWDKTAALLVTMPLELGLYYCTGEYKTDSSWSGTFSTPVTVDKDTSATVSYLPTRGTGGYELRLISVDRVQVTWLRPVSATDFIEARVSRQLGSEPACSLFFTMSGREGFLTGPNVTLSSFRHEDGSPPVVTLYIRRVHGHQYEAGARYDCLVLYRDCVGSKAQFCKCSQEQEGLASGDITTTSTSGLASGDITTISTSGLASGDITTTSTSGLASGDIAAISVSVLLIIALGVIVVFVVMIYLVKHNRCKSIRNYLVPEPKLRLGHQATDEGSSDEERQHDSPPEVQEMRLQNRSQSQTVKPRQTSRHEEEDESKTKLLVEDSRSGKMGSTDSNASRSVRIPTESASNSQNASANYWLRFVDEAEPCPPADDNTPPPGDEQSDHPDVSTGEGSQNKILPGGASVAGAPAAQLGNIEYGGARPKENRPPPAQGTSTPSG